MHIAHLVTRLLRSGSEENTLATCRWQLAAGHRVTLIHGAQADAYWQAHPVPGLSVIALPEMVHPVNPAADARALYRLRQLYRQLAPDVIHTHQSKAGILGRMAASAAPGAIVVHGIHILPFEGVEWKRRQIYLAAERLAARHTDLFIAVSNATGHAYIEAGIARPEQMHCVRSGMDLQRFMQATAPPDAAQLRGPGAPLIVVMMAAFEPRKRHLPFLQALAQQRDMLPQIRILLAGQGPLQREISAQIEALNLQEIVHLCGHRSDPEALLSMADLSILTSEREGLPRVVVQSLAAGCPVALTTLPGIHEIIEPGHNGMIFERDDLAGLVTALGELARHPAQLGALQQGAGRTNVSEWSLEALGARTTALYETARAHPVWAT